MNCPESEDRLLAYDEADASARRAIDAHVSGCAACADFLAALQEVDRTLAGKFAAMTPRAGFDRAVLERTTTLPGLRKPPFWPVVLDFVAAAAMLLVAVSLLNDAAVVFRGF